MLKKAMSSRERLLAMFHYQEVDHIPLSRPGAVWKHSSPHGRRYARVERESEEQDRSI